MKIKTVTILGANGTMGSNVSGIFASFGNAKVYMVSRNIEDSFEAKTKAALSVRPEKSVLGKEFLAKKTGKACPCWLYVIYQKKYNQASGDLSGEEDKQQSEQAQH